MSGDLWVRSECLCQTCLSFLIRISQIITFSPPEIFPSSHQCPPSLSLFLEWSWVESELVHVQSGLWFLWNWYFAQCLDFSYQLLGKNIEFKDLCRTTFPSSKFSCWNKRYNWCHWSGRASGSLFVPKCHYKALFTKGEGGGGFLLSVFIEYPLSLPFLILSNDMEPTIINSWTTLW